MALTRLEISRRCEAKVGPDGLTRGQRRRLEPPNEPRREARRVTGRALTWALGNRKMSLGCMDCHFRGHPAALEFDHRPGTIKLFNIGNERRNPRQKLLDEIAKCDVVCANCHAIRTALRRVS